MKFRSTFLLCILPAILLLFYWLSAPFQTTLSSKSIALSSLSSQQKNNILLASSALNGKILYPNQEFSFNKIVGPRSDNLGYLNARSYLDNDSPNTVGGGICVVSSLVYQAALESNMLITERHAHTRTMQVIPAGLDATVWYGLADLRFRNSTKFPVKIITSTTPQELTVTIVGNYKSDKNSFLFRKIDFSKGAIWVSVFKKFGDHQVLVSRDLYEIPLSSNFPHRNKTSNEY